MNGFLKNLPAIVIALLMGALPVQAESWSHRVDRAIAPRAIAGSPSGGFEAVCYQGEWFMYLFGLSTAEGMKASIDVDGKSFSVQFVFGNGDDGIKLNSAILSALKAGRSVRVSSRSFNSTYALRGSSRALDAVAAGCAYPSPVTSPERFRGAVGESSSEAEALAREILADDLGKMRQDASKPDIDVESAWLVDFDDGWRFIITTVGASNYHFGFNAFGTIVLAKPVTQEWQQVGPHAPSFWVTLDTKARNDGWPNLIYQSERGVNPPFRLWTWNGSKYELSQTIVR